jgi:hypothetical protein
LKKGSPDLGSLKFRRVANIGICSRTIPLFEKEGPREISEATELDEV